MAEIDWTKSMTQTFEYYIVDSGTWKDDMRLTNVTSCKIDRDDSSETLGSASFDVVDSVGEAYIRAYLVASQNGVTDKRPLGTFLVQTPSSSFDGKVRTVSMDAYTPLIELKENQPPLGYSILKGEKIMDYAYRIARENMRAPIAQAISDETLYDDFVSDISDTWLTFLIDLIANAEFSFDLDEMGRVLFAPYQELATLQPVWTFNDDNSSILYSDISMDHDLYGLPNVVEVIYSNGYGSYYARVVNDDVNSPLSTVNRGREIVYRESNPSFAGEPTNNQVQEYAEKLLKKMSTVEYTISYSHGYCPVRVGDCVRLNYERAGITDIKARVTSQSIECGVGCKVSETAVFTKKLWR